MDNLTALEFIAQSINQSESLAKGYAAPTRWLCTNEEYKEHCLSKARKMVEDWKAEELYAKEERNKLTDPRKVMKFYD